jgi:type I restriction enzyme S subunit
MTPQIKQRIEQIRRGEVPDGYKKTKVGVVPNEWEETRFKKMFSRLSRKNKENNDNVLTISAQYGLISQRDFFNKDIASEDKSNYFLLHNGEFAYNKSYSNGYPFGALKRLDMYDKGIVSPLYICFSANENNECPDFYVHYFEAGMMNREIQAFAQEGARNHGLLNISVDDFFNSYLLMPPRPKQEKIAEILSAQDKLIALKEKLIEEKKRQKKALMQQLLTGKKRLPGFSDEWRKIKLSAVLIEGNKVAVVDTSMYRKMTVKLAFKGLEFTKTDREMADTRPFYVRKKNEIIIGKQNYFNGSVALVTDEFDGCICSNAIMSFGVKNANVKFILEYISQVDFMKKREMLANGTGQKELSEKEFLNFEIKLPCIEEQNHIGNIASTCDSEILLLQKNLDQEKQKKKVLMQLLLTGIVRV